MNTLRKHLNIILFLLACSLLAACSADTTDSNGITENTGDEVETSHRGSVGDGPINTGDEVEASHRGSVGDGPIVGSTIVIKDRNEVTLGSITADAFANYKLAVKTKGNSYPLIIESTGGIDLVTNTPPTFTLLSVALRPSNKIVNINPFSTFIVKTAEAMGGITADNITKATNTVLNELNFGFDEALIEDPVLTEISSSSIASIVKSSEILAELIRRTQDSVSTHDNPISEDGVIASLSADMVDGRLDGKGAEGASEEISLRAKVISGQIILEALPNRLRVNNVEATAAMDESIQTIMPEVSPSPVTGNVVTTVAMIAQLQTAINIAQRIAPNSTLSYIADLSEQLGNINPEAAAALLPSDASTFFNESIVAIATLSEDEITALNLPASTSVVNHPPVIAGEAPRSVAEGAVYHFSPVASDADGDQLTYTISNKPVWLEFNSDTGVLTGSPDFEDAGDYSEIRISVTDGQDSASIAPFTISVENINRTPSISGTPAASIVAGNTYRFMPMVSDPDGDTLFFSIVNRPTWSDFDTATGLLTGTPTNADVGQQINITINVSDSMSAVALPPFSISVSITNQPPVIGGTPPTVVTEASNYSFTPTAIDMDGHALTFFIINRPHWASFNSTTGQLSGTPGYSDSGVYSNVTISVSDGNDTTALAPFSISVANLNRTPTISGSPVMTISEGAEYSFTPVANDPDMDPLTFGIINLPSWASFNSTTGQLSGIPINNDVGSYDAITIYVDDDELLASLPSFTIVVDPLPLPSSGSATLNWIAPATRIDGSVLLLSELSGYHIYHGTDVGNLTLFLDINDPGVNEYVIENLAIGTHYFAVVVYDTQGLESEISEIKTKTVQN